MLETQLEIIGYVLIGLALLHTTFPKYFSWKDELQHLSLVNRQMMQVHTFFIAFVVFLIGWLCITSSNELVQTVLGKRVALGIAIFWGIRMLFQFFIYSPKLWKGKTFETVVHVVFSLFWIYLTIIFFMVYKA